MNGVIPPPPPIPRQLRSPLTAPAATGQSRQTNRHNLFLQTKRKKIYGGVKLKIFYKLTINEIKQWSHNVSNGKKSQFTCNKSFPTPDSFGTICDKDSGG